MFPIMRVLGLVTAASEGLTEEEHGIAEVSLPCPTFLKLLFCQLFVLWNFGDFLVSGKKEKIMSYTSTVYGADAEEALVLPELKTKPKHALH